MKKLLAFALLFVSTCAYAETGEIANEVLPDLTEQSTPVLNDILRKQNSDSKAIDVRVTTLEAATPSTVVATQADMEADSSITTYASPGRFKYAPGAAKAVANIKGSDGSINSSYGVSSVVHTTTGTYRIVWTTPFSTANYTVVGNARRGTTGSLMVGVKWDLALAATSCTVEINSEVPALTDPTTFYIAAYGDQ